MGALKRARGLGWFSLGLGLAEIGAPHLVARLVGVKADAPRRWTLRGLGLREILSGIGIVVEPRPAWLWTRVAGDVMDLTLLGLAMRSIENDRKRLGVSTASVVAVTALDAITALQMRGVRPQVIEVAKSITINRSPEEVFAFWRNLENLPRFMAHLESVQVRDGHSFWRARAPAGATVEWEAVIVDDQPNRLIAWQSVEGSDVRNEGVVAFQPAPGDRGTEVHVTLRYEPPAGRLGAAVAKLFGEEPSQQIEGDLRRFKQVIETGEVVHSDASIYRGMHPAQPPKELQ